VETVLVITVVLVLFVAGGWWVSHTRLVGARNEVVAAWADTDAELQRRHDLVPRLVTAVEAAAAHERSLLVELARRNDAALHAPHTPDAASEFEPPVADAIARVVALRERYPELNSQQNFLELQHQLAITEDRVAAARRFYNTRVEELNRRVEAFPSGLVARRHGFAKAAFFDA
jgi:LemA protein